MGTLAATLEDAGESQKTSDKTAHKIFQGGTDGDLSTAAKCGGKGLPVGPKSRSTIEAGAILKSEKRIWVGQKV